MERLAIKKLLPSGSRKFHFPKVNKIGSIIGHAIDYNRGEPAAHTQQKLTQVFPPPPNSGKLTGVHKCFYYKNTHKKLRNGLS